MASDSADRDYLNGGLVHALKQSRFDPVSDGRAISQLRAKNRWNPNSLLLSLYGEK